MLVLYIYATMSPSQPNLKLTYALPTFQILSNEIVSNVLGSTGLLMCMLITDSDYLIEHNFYPLLQWSIKLIVRSFSRIKLLVR